MRKIKHTNPWQNDFGNNYHKRNRDTEHTRMPGLKGTWASLLRKMNDLTTIMEMGAGTGSNLKAIREINETVRLTAVEPNESCTLELLKIPVKVIKSTVQNLIVHENSEDLVFTSGMLIHLDQFALQVAMDKIYKISHRYILALEYFAPKEEKITYREDVGMWRRDYGSLYMDRFDDLKLVDHGFLWKRVTGLDNLTWWLLEKNNA